MGCAEFQVVGCHGPVGTIFSFGPWTAWILPDPHGISKWVVDAFSSLVGLSKKWCKGGWRHGFKLGLIWVPLINCFAPDFVPPAPYLVCDPAESPNGSGILVQPSLTGAHFGKPGCLTLAVKVTQPLPPRIS